MRKGSRSYPAAVPIIKRQEVLAFGELEALARAFLPVLLSLMCASVARKKSELLQFAPQLGVKFNQGARNAQPRRAGLTANSTTVGQDEDVEALRRFGGKQWLPHIGARRLTNEIILEGPVINGDLTFTGPQEDAGSRSLAAAGS